MTREELRALSTDDVIMLALAEMLRDIALLTPMPYRTDHMIDLAVELTRRVMPFQPKQEESDEHGN